MITKGERAELRQMVRQQFKVLRAEVAQREAEVMADTDAQITAKYEDQDLAWAEAARQARVAVEAANDRVNEIYRELMGETQLVPLARLAELEASIGPETPDERLL